MEYRRRREKIGFLRYYGATLWLDGIPVQVKRRTNAINSLVSSGIVHAALTNHNYMFVGSAKIAGDSQPVRIGLFGGKRNILIVTVFHGRLCGISLPQVLIEVTIYRVCLARGQKEDSICNVLIIVLAVINIAFCRTID